MIKKLRLRFILVALISVLVVLSATIAAINAYNYSKIRREAQHTLKRAVDQNARLMDFYNGGQQGGQPGGNPGNPSDPGQGGQGNPGDPGGPGGQPGGDWNWEDMYDENLSRENYFIVCFDKDGNIDDTRSRYNGIFSGRYDYSTGEYISNQDEYKTLATEIYATKSNSGSSDNLWYRREQKDDYTYLAFVDIIGRMNTFNTFLYTSLAVSGISYSVLAALIIVASFFVFRTSEESYRKQKAFITNASHELKTPLTIISTDLDLIEMDNVKNEWTASMRDQVSRLVTMTNQLVTLSRIEENDAKNYPFESFDLSKLANDCAETFAPTYKQNDFKFDYKIAENINIKANKGLINELFYIFLDNALKYTKENGAISLDVKNRGRDVEIAFSNDIKDDDVVDTKQMFERFYRSPNSNKKEGSGVGLSIAKEIINLHKGKITAVIKDKVIVFTIVL